MTSSARLWERHDVVTYLHKRASEFRRNGKLSDAMLIDDLAREIEVARHYGTTRANARRNPFDARMRE